MVTTILLPGVQEVDPGLTVLDGLQLVQVGALTRLELLDLLHLRERYDQRERWQQKQGRG